MEMTSSSATAKARLYTSVGGVPKGFQLRNTKKVAVQSRGEKPEMKQMKHFIQRGLVLTVSMMLGPIS